MPYASAAAAREAARVRQARWRETRRAQGLTIHPERDKRRARGLPARPELHSKPWLFIDTEGANDPEGRFGDPGRQWTYLICAASDDGFEKSLCLGRPLRTVEMLEFILSLPGGKKGTHKLGGFFFSYDICQILHELPEERLRRLYGVGPSHGPIRWRKLMLGLFNTQLRVLVPRVQWPEDPEKLNQVRDVLASRVIWDVGKFYQSSLLKAIENWKVATEEEAVFIERMKSERTAFDLRYWEHNGPELIAYSLLENRLAARLQDKFDRTAVELGYPLTSWYGAGSMAKAMLGPMGVKAQLENRQPIRRAKRWQDDFASWLPYAYFGGRFEIKAPGIYKPVYEYDLRSAYPASYRSLPCLIHGRWRLDRRQAGEDIGPHDLLIVDWRIHPADIWGPFPYRDKDGGISYPQVGQDHAVWGVELLAALELWRQSGRSQGGRGARNGSSGIAVGRHWRYVSECSCHPFGWIDRVYSYRLQLGKDSAGYPLKLGMNAMYGTLASTLGASFEIDDGGDYFNFKGWCEPRWAGLITAWTRAKLLDALRLAGGPRSESPIMFATDAIYTTAPVDGLEISERLGDWEAHRFPHGGLLIQPGLYHLKGQKTQVKLKGRGITFRDMQTQIQEFYRVFEADGERGRVELHLSPRYMGLRLMLHRNDIEHAWRWLPMRREIAFDPSAKRQRMRSGRRMPRRPADYDLDRGHQPHPGLFNLIYGGSMAATLATLTAESQEQWAQRVTEEDQPDGPAAL